MIKKEPTFLRWQLGKETDIGGSRENQDDMFIFEKKESNVCIICVLDGHGREVGRTAAMAGKDFLLHYFNNHLSDVIANPYEALVHSFRGAHDFIKTAFRSQLEQQGFQVEEDPAGFLLKKKPGAPTWGCVHGGTSCSLIAIVESKLYVANVGDSTGILCASGPFLGNSQLVHLGDAAIPNTGVASLSVTDTKSPTTIATSIPISSTHAPDNPTEPIPSDTLILTAEHSPESVSEFTRLRNARPSPSNPKCPEILMLYDSTSHDKSKCPAIFDIGENNIPIVTGKGK